MSAHHAGNLFRLKKEYLHDQNERIGYITLFNEDQMSFGPFVKTHKGLLIPYTALNVLPYYVPFYQALFTRSDPSLSLESLNSFKQTVSLN